MCLTHNVSEISADYSRKNANYSHLVFNALLLKVLASEFCNPFWAQNTLWKNFDDMYNCFSTILALDT